MLDCGEGDVEHDSATLPDNYTLNVTVFCATYVIIQLGSLHGLFLDTHHPPLTLLILPLHHIIPDLLTPQSLHNFFELRPIHLFVLKFNERQMTGWQCGLALKALEYGSVGVGGEERIPSYTLEGGEGGERGEAGGGVRGGGEGYGDEDAGLVHYVFSYD